MFTIQTCDYLKILVRHPLLVELRSYTVLYREKEDRCTLNNSKRSCRCRFVFVLRTVTRFCPLACKLRHSREFSFQLVRCRLGPVIGTWQSTVNDDDGAAYYKTAGCVTRDCLSSAPISYCILVVYLKPLCLVLTVAEKRSFSKF